MPIFHDQNTILEKKYGNTFAECKRSGLNHENLGLHFNDNFATSWEQILHCQHVRKEVGNERQKNNTHAQRCGNFCTLIHIDAFKNMESQDCWHPEPNNPLKQCSSSIHTPTHTTADFEKKLFSSRSIFLNYMTMSSTLVQSARLLWKNDISNYNEPGSSQWTCIFNLPHTEDQTQFEIYSNWWGVINHETICNNSKQSSPVPRQKLETKNTFRVRFPTKMALQFEFDGLGMVFETNYSRRENKSDSRNIQYAIAAGCSRKTSAQTFLFVFTSFKNNCLE